MNISTLQQYVDQKNQWAAIFGQKQLSLLNAADRQAIADSLDANLSPENLTCDGELPRSEVQAKYNRLMRCVEELRSIYSTVTFQEVY